MEMRKSAIKSLTLIKQDSEKLYKDDQDLCYDHKDLTNVIDYVCFTGDPLNIPYLLRTGNITLLSNLIYILSEIGPSADSLIEDLNSTLPKLKDEEDIYWAVKFIQSCCGEGTPIPSNLIEFYDTNDSEFREILDSIFNNKK